MDTQWPRYEVFKQDTPSKPHQAVGSVHAPDAEMALQMARDVFVRRPKCHHLWVVRADAILAVTAQELAAQELAAQELAAQELTAQELAAGVKAPDSAETTPSRRFHIFRKTTQRRAMTYVDHAGTLEAPSAGHALATARDQFGDDAFVWWIVPANAVHASDDVDEGSWFAPARDKTYRHQSAYGFVHPKRRGRHHSQASQEAEE